MNENRQMHIFPMRHRGKSLGYYFIWSNGLFELPGIIFVSTPRQNWNGTR
jgi:hypothetical protein